MIRQVSRALEDRVEHQPGLVQPEIVHRTAHEAAHQRARAVAAHHVAGAELRTAAIGEVPDRQVGGILFLLDGSDFMAAEHMDRGEAFGAGTQDRLEIGLMEIVVVGAAMRPVERGAAAHQQCPP